MWFTLASLLFSSCEPVNPDNVISDNGFDVNAAISWDAEHISNALVLSLNHGEEGEYILNYEIDSRPMLHLKGKDDEDFISGSAVSLSKNTAARFILPTLAEGEEHSMKLEFIREDVKRSYELSLPGGRRDLFELSVKTSADLPNSIVLVKSIMEEAQTAYTLSFLIDGEAAPDVRYQGEPVGEGVAVDFVSTQEHAFELPYISAGEHEISMMAATSKGTYRTDMTFSEPARFAFGADLRWDAAHMAYILDLSIINGDSGEYELSYDYDYKATNNILNKLFFDNSRLKDMSGTVFNSGDMIKLTKSSKTSLIFPSILANTAKKITISAKRGSISHTRTLDISRNEYMAFSAEVAPSDKELFSTVTITSLKEEANMSYGVTFKLDDVTLNGVKEAGGAENDNISVNFSSQKSFTFELPYVASGQHTLTVTLSTSKSSQSRSITFTEPKREATSLILAYNHYNGRLTLSSPYNPFNTSFSVSVGITVKGSVTYRHKQFLGIADAKTEYFTSTGEATARITPGLTAVAIDNGKLKELMDKVFSNARTDAANAIGNGNARTLHSDINSVDLKFTIHSEGVLAGELPVTITPTVSSNFPVRYQYTGPTWNHGTGYNAVIKPTFTVNGASASSIKKL